MIKSLLLVACVALAAIGSAASIGPPSTEPSFFSSISSNSASDQAGVFSAVSAPSFIGCPSPAVHFTSVRREPEPNGIISRLKHAFMNSIGAGPSGLPLYRPRHHLLT